MLQNNQRIIVKVVLGFAVIVSLFFITVKIIHEKLSKLAETVTTILEPNLKLIELKEISGCLYEAEANVKAYSIRKDTVYLANYESQIQILYSHLDTLQYLAAKQMKIVTPAQAATNKVFSTQIDTLRVLILARVNLFEEYIELKTGLKSGDFLVQVAQKMEANRRMAENSSSQSAVPKEKSYFRRLFKSKKNLSENNISPTTGTSDSLQNNLQNIIKEAQFAANRIKGQELSKETDIAQREFLISNKFFSLINIMEEKVLVEKINVINKATAETSSKISFISSWLAILGLIIAIMFANFIYRDIRSSKQYKLGILLTKREAEKSAAQYSRSLIEASRDPLVTISHDGKITDMNEALVRITGISRRVLTGTDFISLFSDPQKAGDGYQRVFQNGFVTDFPLTIGGTEGKLTEVLFNGAVYKNEVEIVLGAVVVARDVTDQRIFEKEMIEAKTQAEQATKRAEDSTQLIEAFLANMSHEIRTPMNAIIGFSELLTSLELGKKEIKYANAIKSAGESLMVIINDILDMSKIEAGMMTFEEDSFSIIETFKSLSVMLSGKAKEKNLDLSFVCSKNVPDVLLGDHTRFTQVIINLAGNAIKFTENGSVRVYAKVLSNEDDISVLEFSVTDTGIGISKEKLERIFERFRQAEDFMTRKYGGTGLGLSIAKQLVELQGGKLWVESELNFGSTFSFYIPFKKPSQIQKKPEDIEKKYDIGDLSKLNILLVEDSDLNVMLIQSLFSENNLSLQVAGNGSVAIAKMGETDFDIILMDMEMPVMNGYEATSIIRNELHNDIPIIAMTAHAMSGERERCLLLGMNDYLSKPINAILLFEKMHNLTKKS